MTYKNAARSVLAVLAGIAAITVTSFAIEAVVEPLMMRTFPAALPDRTAITHSVPASLFTFAYSALCIVFGGYVTAWVARSAKVRHAVIMGAIQAALVIPAMLAYPDLAPLWRWIVGMLLIVPAAWWGGKLRANRPGAGASFPQQVVA